MNKKIIDYRVITVECEPSDVSNKLRDKIEYYIDLGWQPYGQLICIRINKVTVERFGNEEVVYHQPMVLYEGDGKVE